MAKNGFKTDAAPIVPLTFPAPAQTRSNTTVTTGTAVNVTLQANTQLIEINAKDYGLYMRYRGTGDSTDVTSSNNDEYIMPNTTRHYYLPPVTVSISFLGDGGTSTLRYIEK